MSTTSILYVDPSANLGKAPEILKSAIEAMSDDKKALQTRRRNALKTIPGFQTHLDNTFGFAPYDLTVETFFNYVLNKDMAFLKVSFLIQILSSIAGAPQDFLRNVYNLSVFAIYTNISIYIRVIRNTELSTVLQYEPPKILPLSNMADAFVDAFRPILSGQIEEAFESFIADHDYNIEVLAEERELLKLIRENRTSPDIYKKWRKYLNDHADEDQIGEESTATKDRNYCLLADAVTDDDGYLHLRDLNDRRVKTFEDVNKDLREFRRIVMEKMNMKPATGTRTKSTPQMLRALSRKSSVNLMVGSQGGDLVQKSIIVSYLRM